MTADVVQLSEGSPRSLLWKCAGCGEIHCCRIEGRERPKWSWNRSLSAPTLVPSVLKKSPDGSRCHSYVREGVVQFLGDCTHELAGEAVPMAPENAGIPRDPEEPRETSTPT